MNQEENNLFQKKRYYNDKIINIYRSVHGFPENNSSQFYPATRIGFYSDLLDALNNFNQIPAISSLNSAIEGYTTSQNVLNAYNRRNITSSRAQYILESLGKKTLLQKLFTDLKKELESAPSEDLEIVKEIAEEGTRHEYQDPTQQPPTQEFMFNSQIINPNLSQPQNPLYSQPVINNTENPTGVNISNIPLTHQKRTRKNENNNSNNSNNSNTIVNNGYETNDPINPKKKLKTRRGGNRQRKTKRNRNVKRTRKH